MRGEVALHEPARDPEEATRCFERALTIARSRDARLWELRAALSLARLWATQGNPAKARNCWPRSTAGSPRASTRSILSKHGPC